MKAYMERMVTLLHKSQDGFTLVELLIVVSIVVALAAASIVSVTQFTGKGQEGAQAAEGDSVQAAVDTMMADQAVAAVTANDLGSLGSGISDFTSNPTEGALTAYLRDNPTAYFYCWDSTGKILQLTAATACPASPY